MADVQACCGWGAILSGIAAILWPLLIGFVVFWFHPRSDNFGANWQN